MNEKKGNGSWLDSRRETQGNKKTIPDGGTTQQIVQKQVDEIMSRPHNPWENSGACSTVPMLGGKWTNKNKK